MKNIKKFFIIFLLIFGIIISASGCSFAGGVPKYNPKDPNPKPGLYRVEDMHCARNSHKATLLNDGRVLITGGYSHNVGDNARETAEIFDPKTAKFEKIDMLYKHYGSSHNAILLDNGNVLISGGMDTFYEKAKYEIFDYLTSKFYAGPTSALYLDHSNSGWNRLYKNNDGNVFSYGRIQKIVQGKYKPYKKYYSAMEVYNSNNNTVSSFITIDDKNYKKPPIMSNRNEYISIKKLFGYPFDILSLGDDLFFIVSRGELDYGLKIKSFDERFASKETWFSPIYLYNKKENKEIMTSEFIRTFNPIMTKLKDTNKILITGGVIPSYIKNSNEDPTKIPLKYRINRGFALKATKYAYIFIY